jgi:hypothetical protein
MLRCAQHDNKGGPFLPYAGESIPLGSLVLLSLVPVTEAYFKPCSSAIFVNRLRTSQSSG